MSPSNPHFEELYEKLLQEDIKSGLLGLGAASILGLGSSTLKDIEKPIDFSLTTQNKSDITTKQVSVTKNSFDSSKIAPLFGKEYPVIVKAAKRNGIQEGSEEFFILLAIRKSENGPKGREFGILHPKAKDTNLDTQAGWSAATIVKNKQRWEKEGRPGDFITYLGKRYAPIGASNDPRNLNKNWIKNVSFWKEFLEKRAYE